MNLADCFAHVASSAFRLERLPEYPGPRFHAWQAGMPLPERSPDTNPYLALVRDQTAVGVQRTRARLVSARLTEYENHELAEYAANAAAGEEIRIGQRDAFPALDEDYWLFDYDTPAPTVAIVHYDEEGQYLCTRIKSGWHECLRYDQQRSMIWDQLASLADFLGKIRNTNAA